MKNKKYIRNLLTLTSSVILFGGSLIGCGTNNNQSSSVKEGTTYAYKYKSSDRDYIMGTTGAFPSMKGVVGKIKLISDNTATLTNVCYQGWLYKNGKGTFKIINDGVEINLYKDFQSDNYSRIIGPLPKTDKSITVPIDMCMDVNVTYSKVK